MVLVLIILDMTRLHDMSTIPDEKRTKKTLDIVREDALDSYVDSNQHVFIVN